MINEEWVKTLGCLAEELEYKLIHRPKAIDVYLHGRRLARIPHELDPDLEITAWLCQEHEEDRS
jgi:hypothetical protein